MTVDKSTLSVKIFPLLLCEAAKKKLENDGMNLV
jgi:hypothetical protein